MNFDEKRPSTDPHDPLYRIRVTREFDGALITISEELLTSTRHTAQVTSTRAAIDLTTEEAEWLHEKLGKALGRP